MIGRNIDSIVRSLVKIDDVQFGFHLVRRLVQTMYSGAKSSLKISNKLSEKFTANVGVRQRSVPSLMESLPSNSY